MESRVRRLRAVFCGLGLFVIVACGDGGASNRGGSTDPDPYYPPIATPTPRPTPEADASSKNEETAPSQPLTLRLTMVLDVLATFTVSSLTEPRIVGYRSGNLHYAPGEETVKFPILGRESARAFEARASNGDSCNIQLMTSSSRYVSISHDLVFKRGQSYEVRDLYFETRGSDQITLLAKISGLQGPHNYLPSGTYGALFCELTGKPAEIRRDPREALNRVLPSYFDFYSK